MGRWTVCVIASLVFLATVLTGSRAERGNHCLAKAASSCSVCIQAGQGCSYCADAGFDKSRCDLEENLLAHGCKELMTVSGSMSVVENSRIDTSISKSQVAPQRIQMSLLPGEVREVEMEVFEPLKGPLDLYILMDFSNSMSDDLANLKKMGAQLAKLVKKLSDDYTIGFGKFVDKVTAPQTDMRPSKLAQPWPDSDPPFSFRNAIRLTNNVDVFNDELQKERISGNLDAPEGGFDAILQAAVCKDQIGWRKDSTHLLVFSTESAFHYEADGANVLAGILPRNDEACHLDVNGSYTHATKQDYPSVPTLVRLLVDHSIIPVFAVTNHSYTYYYKLHEYFPLASVGELQEDSSNILEILEKAFLSIRSKISIRAEDKPKAVDAQILSYAGADAKKGQFDFKPGQIGKFKVRVEANSNVGESHVCDISEEDRRGTIRVKPTTFSSALRIQADVLCKTCECEKSAAKNSPLCHGTGDLVCGKCQCHTGWVGPTCNCSMSDSGDSSSCKGPDMKEPCSGRGDCLCGMCVCHNPNHEGPFCEYDKTQCPRFGGFLCNDRGTCSMGKCQCLPGWTGSSCECTTSEQPCVDSKGGVCNGRGTCKCGRCECENTGLPLSATCEASFQAQLGMCEDRRSCVQCKAWNTGENKGKKCDACHFNVTLVDELKNSVVQSCSFRDEDDDCTYHYTVDYPLNANDSVFEVEVLKKRDCPPGSFLWLIPLIMFLMLLLGLLLLCCWKYCKGCAWCLGLLPCCARGRKVGFKEEEYMLRHSLLTSDHLDTPLIRTGPPKDTDVVRWKITDNVHRSITHPQVQMKPNPKELIQFPLSLRLNRMFSDSLSRPEARDTELLRQEVEDNLNNIYKQIPGTQKVQKTKFRTQRNAGKRKDNAIVDTVLSAPRGCYTDIVKLTEKHVQNGSFSNLKVVPGYYTVATDREATGLVEMQKDVELVDVRVPLFVKDEDDDKKQLQVEALDVPVGIAELGRRFVNITIIKDHAKSILTFLQPSYTYSRQERVANIPISREILEDGPTQVSYRTRDLTAKDKKDYISKEGDLMFQPGETEKTVAVQLLELGEGDGLLEDNQVKQFVMDLSNPRQGAKLGRYPRTTVTISDQQEPSVVMFKKSTQTFNTADPVYTIPVVRMRNTEGPSTVHWRTNKASRFEISKPLKFSPGESEKNIVIEPQTYPGPVKPESFQLELFDPSSNSLMGERRTTLVNVVQPEQDNKDWDVPVSMGFVKQSATSPGGRLPSPDNIKATPTGPKSIRVNWTPISSALGYKVKYWIYGDPEEDAQIANVKNPQAELTNLYPYCDYEMRVCAYNAITDGHYSDIVPCQTLEDVPSEPGRLAFNVISPTVTQLSWAEPAEPNGVITSYEVIYTPIDEDSKPIGASKKVKIDNPKKRMLLIENLQPSQTYCYKVRARNKVGWGPFRDATINLATQPNRPMSIPIIPDIPIVDAEAGEEYDSYLMYSNEVLRSPGGSKRPSMSDEGLRWKHVQLVGDGLDLRKVSWKLPADIIHHERRSTDTESSEEPGQPSHAQTPLQDQIINGKWDQNFLFPGGGGSLTRNMSASSSNYSLRSPTGGTLESTTTYMFSKGSPRLQEEVIMRKRSENRALYEHDGVRDSIVMGDMPSGFADGLSGYSYSKSMASYSVTSRARTQSEDVNDALMNLDRVLQETRMTPGVPDTPTRLVFSALGPTALKVSWQEPHCEREVLGYCVLYQLLNGGEMKRIDVTNPGQNSVIVQDLLPNHSYIFKVKAQSQEGWGPEREGVITIESAVDPKSPLSPVPGSPFTLSTPSAPGPLIFTALSPEALQLSWEKPRKPNGEILGYVVTCEQLHGGGDVRTFQVSGANAETSLTVNDLTENIPYKFKVQAQTTQGFGPEREGIITIESQDGGSMSSSMYNNQSMITRREVFNMPGEVSTVTNVSHSMFNEPFFSDGMMISTQTSQSSGTITRQMEMVQRGVVSSTSVTKKIEKQYYQA